MSDEYTPTLQQTPADREDWWSAHAGSELAHWLRGIAAKCRLPYFQGNRSISPGGTTPEPIVSAAQRRSMIGEPPDWAFWVILGLLGVLMLLPVLRH